MKKLIYFFILVLAAIIYFTLTSGEPGTSYRTQVAEIRKKRIDFLKNSDQSPFRLHNKKFHPPTFFPVDEQYKVRAKLQKLQSIERIPIKTSNGETNLYTKFAYALFNLKGQELKLLILKPAGFGLPNTYFTAFADQTSALASYGGGRYLDLEIGKSDKIEIDFNLAYNPYCAYTKDYSCPLPPAENILPISIEAGEKDYNH